MTVTDRLIIESLRTGVPNPAVINAMGSNQVALLSNCRKLLDETRRITPRTSNGLVFFGDFGAGKSHALQTLAEDARQSGFIVSEGAVSRNLQLGDTKQLLSLLLSQSTSATHPEDAFTQTIDDFLDLDDTHERFAQWASREFAKGRLASHFKLIAENIHRVKYGSPEFEILIDFLHGQGAAPQIRKITGKAPTGSLPAAERPWQTIRFLARLFMEAGKAGWLVLLDELELIRLVGQSPTVGRGKSYVGLSRWMGLGSDGITEGLAVVGCMTRGYVEQQILPGPESQNELRVIPEKLKLSATPELSPIAKRAMDFVIAQAALQDQQLVRPTDEFLSELQSRLRSIYGSAFGCSISELEIVKAEFEPIRVQIRRWIVQWDLERHGIKSNVSVQALTQNLEGVDESIDEI
jgi:hypothetical protein